MTRNVRWKKAGGNHTVTFETDGGTAVAPQKINDGDRVVKPVDPVKGGFVFGGWYSDSALTEKYTFTTKVTSDLTLYAKWYEDLTFASEPSLSDTKITVDGRPVIRPLNSSLQI